MLLCVCGGGLCCGSEEVSGQGRILREVLGQFLGGKQQEELVAVMCGELLL